MRHQEVSKGLWRDDHGGDGLQVAGEEGGTGAQEVPGGAVGHPAELAVEGAVEEEGLSQSDRDGEDELPIGDDGEHFLHHPLRPGDGSTLSAGGAKSAALAGEGDQLFFFLFAIRIEAAQPHEPVVQVAAAEEPLQELPDPRGKAAVALAEARVPDAEELLQGVLDDLLEVVPGAPGPVPGSGAGG